VGPIELTLRQASTPPRSASDRSAPSSLANRKYAPRKSAPRNEAPTRNAPPSLASSRIAARLAGLRVGAFCGSPLTRRRYHCRGQPGSAPGTPALVDRQNPFWLPDRFFSCRVPGWSRKMLPQRGTEGSNPPPSQRRVGRTSSHTPGLGATCHSARQRKIRTALFQRAVYQLPRLGPDALRHPIPKIVGSQMCSVARGLLDCAQAPDRSLGGPRESAARVVDLRGARGGHCMQAAMCGRFRLSSDVDEIKLLFSIPAAPKIIESLANRRLALPRAVGTAIGAPTRTVDSGRYVEVCWPP
jgi:hypothetical protein